MTTSTVCSDTSVEDRQAIGERARDEYADLRLRPTGRRRPGGPTRSSCWSSRTRPGRPIWCRCGTAG